MRVFDESKTIELKEYDLEKGFLKPEQLFIKHHSAIAPVKAQGHYEVIREYPNGGKDVEWVIDVPEVAAKFAWDEYEDINVFIPFTAKELADREIKALKAKLSETDYKAIKYAEGVMSAEEYAPIKAERQGWRDRINELEEVQE